MTTSGINTKNYDADYIIRRASKIAGGEPMSGSDAEDALDMLNELMWAMSNSETPLSRIKEKSFTCSASVTSYDLPSSVIALYDAVLTRSSVDQALGRVGRSNYLRFSNKRYEGKPSQYTVDSSRTSLTVFLYPRPDQDGDTFKYRGALRPQIVTNMHQTLDLHDRYVLPVIYGLAYKMCFERPGTSVERVMLIKQEYDKLLQDASEEDRERTDFRIVVGN